MNENKRYNHAKITPRQKLVGGIVVSFVFFLFIFVKFAPPAADWIGTFYPVARNPLQPYKIPTFINPPWTVVLLWPLGLLPVNWAQAVNATLNLIIIALLVIKKGGGKVSLIMTLSSFPFLSLLANGSIEWIPALGFIFMNEWGLPFLLAKPQSGLLAGLVWFRNLKNPIRFILPSLGVVVLSFFIWKNWIGDLLSNVAYMQNIKVGLFTVSISLWPWSIIPGSILLIYLIWRLWGSRNSQLSPSAEKGYELIAIAATLCFSPYFVPHSLTIIFALLSAYNRKLGTAAWILLWLYPIITHWIVFISILGFRVH